MLAGGFPLPCLRGDFNCLQDRLKLQLLQLRPHWGGPDGWSGAEVAPFRITTYQVKVKWSGSELKEMGMVICTDIFVSVQLSVSG